jgi:hypothetical protein
MVGNADLKEDLFVERCGKRIFHGRELWKHKGFLLTTGLDLIQFLAWLLG